MTPSKNWLITGVALSFSLWYVVFLTDYLWSFWYRVTLASLILMTFAFIKKEDKIRIKPEVGESLIGIASGLALYLLFFFGFNLFRSLVEGGATNVYTFRSELPLWIPAFLLLITSFCEEYFWRYYIQNEVVKTQKNIGVYITSFLYAAIHIPTFNFPLIMAALIAGTFWGIIYSHTKSLWLVVFSHVVWTELIFVFLPLV
jgi:membrane protease YdiL (CAAX protease family)